MNSAYCNSCHLKIAFPQQGISRSDGKNTALNNNEKINASPPHIPHHNKIFLEIPAQTLPFEHFCRIYKLYIVDFEIMI